MTNNPTEDDAQPKTKQEQDAAMEDTKSAQASSEDKEKELRERLKAKTESRNAAKKESAEHSHEAVVSSQRPRSDSREHLSRRGSGGSGGHRRDSHPPRRRGSDHRDSTAGGGYNNRDRQYGHGGPPARGGPPPPQHWRGPPRGPPDGGRRYPPPSRGDDYRRRPRRSRSRSSSRSRSRSRDRHRRGRNQRSRGGHRSRSSSRSASSRSSYSDSDSDSSSSSGSGSDSSGCSRTLRPTEDPLTKDQRTVFVSQLVMRATSRDITKYFRKKGIRVNDVMFLLDKRTGRHKGSAYVELRKMLDIPKAVELSAQAPDFQRFPILIKASEAEKNYQVAVPAGAAAAAVPGTVAAPTGKLTASQAGAAVPAPMVGPSGKLIEAQRVYVGSLDPSVTQEHLFALFSPLGQLIKVVLQTDSATATSKGFAFLTFRDPKEANLAIQTMAGQVLAARPMKTGWATHQTALVGGVEVVKSEEFPDNAAERTAQAYHVLAQLTNGAPVAAPLAIPGTAAAAAVATGPPRPGTVAEARATLAASTAGAAVPTQAPMYAAPAGAAVPVAMPNVAAVAAVATVAIGSADAMKVGGAESPTTNVLIHNMYNKDEETDPGWAEEIRTEFEEEGCKHGKIIKVTVMSEEPGGKIYAQFDSVAGAQSCASSLAGRWFDKRQLRVEFVAGDALP